MTAIPVYYRDPMINIQFKMLKIVRIDKKHKTAKSSINIDSFSWFKTCEYFYE